MTKKPFFNALAASCYIVSISLIMNWGIKMAPKEDSFLAPVAMISLFTLSAAVMAYLFGYQPFQLYFDNKRKEAVNLFLQTVLIFGLITALFLGLLFSGILSSGKYF